MDFAKCVQEHFAFPVPAQPSRHLSDLPVCISRPEQLHEAGDAVVPPSQPVLFIIGAQKSGTTWLYNALTTHPAMIGALRAPKYVALSVLRLGCCFVRCSRRITPAHTDACNFSHASMHRISRACSDHISNYKCVQCAADVEISS